MLKGAQNTEATFDRTVKGVSLLRGERLALAFTSLEDAPFDEPPVRLSSQGGEESEASVESATCYDRVGRVVTDPGLTLTSSK